MKITAFVWVCACAYGHASVRISGGVNAECVRRGVLAHFQSLFLEFSAERHLKGVLRLSFSLCCVRSWIHTRSDLYHSHAPKPPKPHVNLDNGGLGDSGNCCLSVQWKERLSCNGSPVGSVCKLLCTAAVWGVPPELHISVLFWLAAWFGWYQFIWRLSLLLSRWVSAFVACTSLNEAARSPKEKFTFYRFVSDVKLFLRLYSASTALTF